MAKQVPEQNGMTHFEAGDTRAKEYVSLLKSNDPVGFNIVDVLAWGSIGHIVAYYILATASNGYDPNSPTQLYTERNHPKTFPKNRTTKQTYMSKQYL